MAKLGREAVPAIAELCRRGMATVLPPSEPELARALFDPARPAVVRGDPARGVVATVARRGQGFVRLLVVDPAARGSGLGSALLAAGEVDLEGLPSVTVGADAPDHLFPGVPLRETVLLTLLEARDYRRVDVALNLDVAAASLPAVVPAGYEAGPEDAAELAAWVRGRYPRWEDEVARSLRSGAVVLARDAGGIAGFCAWGANRAGWLGPMAVDPGRRGQGIGAPLLRAALARMRADGDRHVQIAWVTTVAFYAKAVSATVGDAYAICSKPLPGS
ncbi:hypothetical protein BH18ACT1_BH18ACT1_08430 [soil metagenome]